MEQQQQPPPPPTLFDELCFPGGYSFNLEECVRRISKVSSVNERMRTTFRLEDLTDMMPNSTPLMLASRIGMIDAVDFLLGQGADVRLVDSDGNSAFHHRAFAWHDEDDGQSASVIRALAEADRDKTTIDKRNTDGFTALWLAAQDISWAEGETATIEHFLQCGANINIAHAGGMTVLMYAIEHCHLALVGLCINYGADTLAVDEDGRDAADYAKKSEVDKRDWMANAKREYEGAEGRIVDLTGKGRRQMLDNLHDGLVAASRRDHRRSKKILQHVLRATKVQRKELELKRDKQRLKIFQKSNVYQVLPAGTGLLEAYFFGGDTDKWW